MKKSILLLSMLGLSIANFSLAEEIDKKPTQNEIEDSVTGVMYEVDENGNFARIRAVGQAELDIGDRKDIRMAIQKAQLRAKANIAKFLNERITSEETLSSIENKVTDTERSGDKVTKKVNRQTIEESMEKIQNNAEAILKGVIATKSDVNKDEHYVEVEMGYSPKTQRAADTMQNNLNSNLGENSSGAVNNSSGEKIEGGREIKKIKNYDNF